MPNYEGTLILLKPGGIFVKWDWLKTDADSDFGLTEAMIKTAFSCAGFGDATITRAFSLESSEGAMPVLMGVAKNT
ncbi:MAG: hypothetical protein OEX12_02935 [Gammaproteobacteria bacterium]|nr:hypothetical protein [Gammaproteobacteria bacterium]